MLFSVYLIMPIMVLVCAYSLRSYYVLELTHFLLLIARGLWSEIMITIIIYMVLWCCSVMRLVPIALNISPHDSIHLYGRCSNFYNAMNRYMYV